MNIEVSSSPSIATISEDLELDTNYSNASITRSDSNVTVVNCDYTKKVFRNDIRYDVA